MRESVIYQDMLQQGLQQGLQPGEVIVILHQLKKWVGEIEPQLKQRVRFPLG